MHGPIASPTVKYSSPDSFEFKLATIVSDKAAAAAQSIKSKWPKVAVGYISLSILGDLDAE